jgi:hypothetical protein
MFHNLTLRKQPSQVKSDKSLQIVNKLYICDKSPYNKNQKPRAAAFLKYLSRLWAIANKNGKLVNGAVHISRKYIVEVIFQNELSPDAVKDFLDKMRANGDFFCEQGKDLGCKNWSKTYNTWIDDSSWYYSFSPIETNKNSTPLEYNPSGYNLLSKIRKLGVSFLERKNYLYDMVKNLGISEKEQLDFDQRLPHKRLRADVLEKVRKKKGWDFATTRIFADAFCARHTKENKSIMVDQYQAFKGWCDNLQKAGFMQTWYYMKSVKLWRPA